MEDKFVSRHGPKTITTRVVKMRYPRNVQFLKYKIRSNYYTCTLEYGNKLRHRGIIAVYVGVKLLYKHDGTSRGFLK